MAAEVSQKEALRFWQEYADNIRKQTALLTGETAEQQARRIAILEADPELWFKYYFPQYCYAEPADFHKAATKRIIENAEWYEVRQWSRELAKSVRSMMEVLFLMLTGKKKFLMLISNSYDNAERLITPYKLNLENNQRIIHDYGVQELPGNWEAGEFKTRKGCAFRALGAGQSPRGARNEETRPDIILFDDIDTDEDCRNADTIQKKWEWIENAAIGTRSVSMPLLVIFLGNKIATDCCVTRAAEYADHVEMINIRNEDGASSWPQKNTEEHIDRVLSKISYASQQKEYYNNPFDEGQTFKEMYFAKVPPLNKLPFVVVYADPATSNKDKPGLKSKMNNSCKVVVIVGYYEGKWYIYKCWVDHTTNAKFIDWLYAAQLYIAGKCTAYYYIENNTLQDPFYQQLLLPLIFSKSKEHNLPTIGIIPDTRQKPEKFFRVEAELEPKNRMGQLLLNKDEEEEPHMKRLVAQFKGVSVNSKLMDAPDAVEGAVHIIKTKLAGYVPGSVKGYKKTTNRNRF